MDAETGKRRNYSVCASKHNIEQYWRSRKNYRESSKHQHFRKIKIKNTISQTYENTHTISTPLRS